MPEACEIWMKAGVSVSELVVFVQSSAFITPERHSPLLFVSTLQVKTYQIPDSKSSRHLKGVQWLTKK